MINSTIYLATRGSALALAQANMVLAACRAAFPDWSFDLKIIKTTGDKLQTAALAQENKTLPKGLFTKELEVALLEGSADLAVHSLKDLPTELPNGLSLGAVARRADVRDVLVYRGPDSLLARTGKGRAYPPGLKIQDLPPGAVVATSSTRRRAQLLTHNADLQAPDIRGNVLTRMQKLADKPELDGTLLALAGLTRLKYQISADAHLLGEGVPPGLLVTVLDPEVMMPCVGQGAIGIEVRGTDSRAAAICEKLNDPATLSCVTAERAFLAAMGGGCQSPVAAYAEPVGDQLRMRALSYASGPVRHTEGLSPMHQAAELGARLAAQIKG